MKLWNLKTNSLQDLEQEDVVRSVVEGTHAFDKTQKVYVENSERDIGDIPPEDAKEAFIAGYRWIPEENLSHEMELDENWGEDATLKALGLGVLGGASVNLSDIGLAIGGYKDELAHLYEENPIATTVGRFVGTVLPFAWPLKGAGVAAKGMKYLPVNIVDKIAAGLGTRITGLMPKKISNNVIARGMLSNSMRGAFEGAAHATTGLYVDETLYDREYTASSYLANAGYAALISGGVMGVASGALAAVKRGTDEKTLSNLYKDYLKIHGAQRKTLKRVEKIYGETDFDKRVKEMAEFLREVKVHGNARIIERFRDKYVNFLKNIEGDIYGKEAFLDHIDAEIMNEAEKYVGIMTRKIPREAKKGSPEWFRAIFTSSEKLRQAVYRGRNFFDNSTENIMKFMEMASIKKGKIFHEMPKKIEYGITGKDLADHFYEHAIKRLEETRLLADGTTKQVPKIGYENVWRRLKNEQSSLELKTNRTISEAMQKKGNVGDPNQVKLVNEYVRKMTPYSDIDSLIKNDLDTFNKIRKNLSVKDLFEVKQHIQKYTKGQWKNPTPDDVNFVESLRTYNKYLDDKIKDQIGGRYKSGENFRGLYELANEQQSLYHTISDMFKDASNAADAKKNLLNLSPSMRWLGIGAVGGYGLSAGSVATAVGVGAAGFAVRKYGPIARNEIIRSLQRGAITTGEKIINSADSFVMKAAPKKSAFQVMGFTTGEILRKLEDTEEAYRKIHDEFIFYGGDAEQSINLYNQWAEPLKEVAPESFLKGGELFSKGITHLGSRLPKTANRSEILSYMRSREAVLNPNSVFDMIAIGEVHKEHIDALKTVYEGLYHEFVSQLFQSISELKTPLEYEKQLKLYTITNMEFRPSLRRSNIAALQAIGSALVQEEAGVQEGNFRATTRKVLGGQNNVSAADAVSHRR